MDGSRGYPVVTDQSLRRHRSFLAVPGRALACRLRCACAVARSVGAAPQEGPRSARRLRVPVLAHHAMFVCPRP